MKRSRASNTSYYAFDQDDSDRCLSDDNANTDVDYPENSADDSESPSRHVRTRGRQCHQRQRCNAYPLYSDESSSNRTDMRSVSDGTTVIMSSDDDLSQESTTCAAGMDIRRAAGHQQVHVVSWMPATCQLCFTDGLAPVVASVPPSRLSLNELGVLASTNVLNDTAIVVSSCGRIEHSYCARCIRTLTTTHADRTVRNGRGYVQCPASLPNNACGDAEGRAYTLSLEALRFFLSPVEVVHLMQLMERYRTVVDHAGASLRIATDRLNHFVWSKGKLLCPYFPALVAQDSIEVDEVLRQLQFLMTTDGNALVMCKECGVFLSKTSQCNALSHCGVEVCNICGYSDVTIPPSHWNRRGDTTTTSTRRCPRYDDDPAWMAQCSGYQCQETVCFDHDRECTIPQHQPGIQATLEARRVAHLKCLLASLPKFVVDRVRHRLDPVLYQRFIELFPV